jgi:hypothetical protein
VITAITRNENFRGDAAGFYSAAASTIESLFPPGANITTLYLHQWLKRASLPRMAVQVELKSSPLQLFVQTRMCIQEFHLVVSFSLGFMHTRIDNAL